MTTGGLTFSTLRSGRQPGERAGDGVAWSICDSRLCRALTDCNVGTSRVVFARVRILLACTLLVASVASSHAAQDADATGAISTPPSFQALRSRLAPGQDIVVHDDTGQVRRGRVSEIGDDRVVVSTRRATPLLRLLNPARTYTFPAAAVTRIDAVDSTVNGTLIGAAAGAGILYGFVHTHRRDLSANNLAPAVYMMIGAISVGGGAVVGEFIDGRINRALYRSALAGRGVTLAPAVGLNRVGVRVTLRFTPRGRRDTLS